MALNLITAPALEPVTLQEAKDHLRVTGNDEDALISELIIAARQQAETFTRRALLTQTWELYLDCFNGDIELPNPPLQSVESIKYIDLDGVEQTLAATEYKTYAWNEPGVIAPAYGKAWPSTRAEKGAVTVRYIAGWQTAADVPAPIKSAILLMIGHLYENREDSSPLTIHQIPRGAEYLMWPYKIISF